MKDPIVTIGLVVYCYFAARWGYRFLDGRWAWLEAPGMKVTKIIVSSLFGIWGYTIYILFWLVSKIVP